MKTVHSPARRDFLATWPALGALAALGASTGAGAPSKATTTKAPPTNAPRVLRIAHLTDVHVMPGRDSDQGFAAALRHAQGQTDQPELIFFGGDLIMDGLKATKDEALAQWAVWDRVVAAELKTEAIHCIGNHDVWGWARHRDAAAAQDPLYGKAMVLEHLGLSARYRSFDRAGWHFVVLDSTHYDPASSRGYTARLDPAQFDWLVADLAATLATTPVCVLSHIPILSMCPFLDGENEVTGDWIVPGAWVHIDGRELKTLFREHANVKVCLSGHVHLADSVRYLGVDYHCNGAVSGGWWKGPYQEFDCAYALVDFYADGTSTNELVFVKA